MKYRHLLLVLVVQLALAVGCAHAHAHPDPRAHAHDHIHPHPPKHQPQHEKQNHQPGPTTSEPTTTTTTTTRPSLPSPSIPPLVALDIFGEHSIRIRIAPPGGHLVDPPIRAILPFAPNITSYDMPDDAITHIHGYSNITLTNGNLRIDVDNNGIITATRISDQTRLLTQQSCIFGTPIIQGGGLLPSSVSGIISFRGTHGEAIYGLGEHHNGQINQMGYQGDTRDSQYYPDSHGGDVMLPYYSSSLGYGFLFNTASHFNVSMSPLSYTWGMHAAANMDFWITTTSTTPPTPATAKQSFIAELLQHYASVVGYASPMPYYVSGFWQCKLRYRSQQEVLSVARGYVDRNLPISLIVVDYFHWTHFGDWSFNQTCWPNVQDMVTELKNLGIELAVSFWPFVTKESSHYEEFMVNHTYVWTDRFSNGTVPLSLEAWEDSTGAYLVDQTEDAVRKAVFQAFWDGYGQYGIRTVWLDASEPERMGYNYGDFSTISHGTDIEQGMSWTRFHAKFMYDGFLSRGYTTSDFFSLSRSTWSGGQSYSNAIWSGDTQSTFEELYTHVRMGQGVALSGQILWTTDIGGFCCADQNDPYFQQLIVRWMQFGAFCPIMRLHGHRLNEPPDNQCGNTGGDNEIWNLAADQVHYDAMVAMMRLREQLRPYIMSINLVASRTGLPMIRPLFLEFPWDPECYNHDGSYMFGDTWLVSPITTYNQLNANIYLPILQDKNQQWVYWFNQEFTYSGGQHVFLQTPINEFPLFYRQNKDVQMKMEEN